MGKRQTLVLVLLAALLFAVGFFGGDLVRNALAPVPAAVEQELFDAVQAELRAAHLGPQDLPKKVLEVRSAAGADHYHVHMEMGLGDAWFDLRKEGGRWVVKGMAPPR